MKLRNGKMLLGIGLFALTTGLIGCGSDAQKEDEHDDTSKVVTTLEAEEAILVGDVKVVDQLSDYSQTQYISGFVQEGDSCTFEFDIDKDDFYDLQFILSADEYKENKVSVDGVGYGSVVAKAGMKGAWQKSNIEKVYMTKGRHAVKVEKYWGHINLDRMLVLESKAIPNDVFEIDAKLSNADSTEETKRLMSYLADTYGEKILSGQYCDTGMYGKEFAVINKATAKTPAVLGLDFIEYSPSRVANGSQGRATEFAMKFWEEGGIVTFCWHWNAPEKYLTDQWYSGFYTEHTNIDLAKIMNGENPEGYDLLLQDIDAIAKQLLILKDAGVPVLWRPLHEASGGWFWWGAKGPEAYKQLYILLYDKLTNEYGCNNLIWIWNGQDEEWYPGDEYVDMIGWDIYPGEHEYGSQVGTFLRATRIPTENKMVVLSENGCVPDPKQVVRDNAKWGFWCTWGGEFVAKNISLFTYSDVYTEESRLKEFYEDEFVLTLDEIPSLKEYPIRKELK